MISGATALVCEFTHWSNLDLERPVADGLRDTGALSVPGDVPSLRSDFDDSDAMSLQPFPHPRPQARFPLPPSPHALGRNDPKRQLIAVGCFENLREIGP